MEDRAAIVLTRPEEDGGGEFSVLLDGHEVETLGSGDVLELEVPTGTHSLRLRFAWISSEELHLDLIAGQHLALEAYRAFGFGPFDIRYFTQRRRAIAVGAPRPPLRAPSA